MQRSRTSSPASTRTTSRLYPMTRPAPAVAQATSTLLRVVSLVHGFNAASAKSTFATSTWSLKERGSGSARSSASAMGACARASRPQAGNGCVYGVPAAPPHLVGVDDVPVHIARGVVWRTWLSRPSRARARTRNRRGATEGTPTPSSASEAWGLVAGGAPPTVEASGSDRSTPRCRRDPSRLAAVGRSVLVCPERREASSRPTPTQCCPLSWRAQLDGERVSA